MQRKYLERSIKSNGSQTFKIEYIPIYKLGVTMAKIKSMVIGTSYDWGNRARYNIS
jgi:hypothetical protein